MPSFVIRNTLLPLALRLVLVGLLFGRLEANEGTKVEREIEALLTYVGSLDGAAFIRNGSEHTPAQAVDHLRLKWDKQKDKILTAEDFIARCATQSSMTGTPYQIRFKDGSIEPAAEVLKRELLRLRTPTTGMNAGSPELVVLLHGLFRTSKSMDAMEGALKREGYETLNLDYPSRRESIETIANGIWKQLQETPAVSQASKVHFVTHSMGGILVRQLFHSHVLPNLGRVVMLGPPNQGSELVDKLGGFSIFTFLNGPAGKELGTDRGSKPNLLGAVNFEVGVIAGTRSINWINSLMIAGPNDGKVSVQRTKVAGMRDHLILPTTHTFMTQNKKVMAATLRFLRLGSFGESACS